MGDPPGNQRFYNRGMTIRSRQPRDPDPMPKSPPLRKCDTSGSFPPLAGIDVCILVYLLGEVVSPRDPIGSKRGSLMAALNEWLGGDAWIWLLAGPRIDGEPLILDSRHHGMGGRETSDFFNGMSAGDSAGASSPALTITRPGDISGMQDGVCQSRRRADGLLACVGIFRRAEREQFSDREIRLARIVMDEVDWLYEDKPPPAGAGERHGLSPRQGSIMDLLLQGWDRKRIAGHLGISHNTLAGHIKEIYRRMGVRSHAELFKAGRRDGTTGTHPHTP